MTKKTKDLKFGKKIYLAIGIAIVGLLAVSYTVSANAQNIGINFGVNSVIDNKKIDTQIAQKCTQVDAKLRQKVGYYQTKRAELELKLTKMEVKFDEAMAKLKTRGCNVSLLESDKTYLLTLIGKVEADMDLMVAALNNVLAQNSCSNTEKYKTDLKGLQTHVDTVKADIKAIRDYIQGSIKPHIAQVRSSGCVGR